MMDSALQRQESSQVTGGALGEGGEVKGHQQVARLVIASDNELKVASCFG